jgi:hypothetical protein
MFDVGHADPGKLNWDAAKRDYGHCNGSCVSSDENVLVAGVL